VRFEMLDATFLFFKPRTTMTYRRAKLYRQ